MSTRTFRFPRWLSAGVMAFGALLLLNGCAPPNAVDDASDDEVAGSGAEVTTLVEPVTVVDTAVDSLTDGTAQSLTFAAAGLGDDGQIGDVLISSNPKAPFIRRVTDRIESDDGSITLATEDVALDELFDELRISRYASFGDFVPAAGVEVNSQAFRFAHPAGLPLPAGSEIPLTDLDLTVKVADGSASASVGLKVSLSALFELEKSGWLTGLERVKFALGCDYEFAIGIAQGGELFSAHFVKSVGLGRIPVRFMLGPVPVFGNIVLSMDVSGDVKGALTVTFKGDVQEAGGEWTADGGWKRVFAHRSLAAEGKAKAEVGLQALLVSRFYLYGLRGPQIGVGPAISTSYALQDPCELEYEMAFKVEGGIDFGKVLGDVGLKDKNFGFEFKEELYKDKFKFCEQDKPVAPLALEGWLEDDQPPTVGLAWKDNSDNEEQFLIQWNDGSGWGDLTYVPAGTSAYVHSTPSAGLDNLYQVFAVGAKGTLSDASNMVVVSIEEETAPSAPEGLTASLEDNALVTLAWTATSENELGFRIERSTGSSGTFAEIGTVGAGETTFVDPAIEPEQTYRYRVLAYNGVGDSGYSNIAPIETKLFDLADQVPAAPTRLAATLSGEDSVQLTWSDNSSREDGFVVDRSVAGGAWTSVQVGADTISYWDSGLVAGTTYFYQVSAYNGAGSSAYTDVVTVTIDSTDDGQDDSGGDDTSDGSDGGTVEVEYVVWYDPEDACWDAPGIRASQRSTFEDASGSPVEMQGGFATLEEAQAWTCDQIQSRLRHYWCAFHDNIGGKYYRVPPSFNCDYTNVPREDDYDW